MRKALFLLLVASCGDNAVPRMPLTEFLRERHVAECVHLTRCGLFSTETACNRYFRWPSDAPLIKAIENDKIRYDGTASFDCLEALASIGCDRTQVDARTTPAACDKVFQGRVDDGEACAFHDECRSGICEDIPACTRDTCCYGTCATSLRSPVDGACRGDSQCVEGTYCHKSHVCRARIGENMSCDDARGCEFGLACVGVTDLQAGTCRRLPATGQACPYKECSDINAVCSNSNCIALGLPGAACSSDAECTFYGECDEIAGHCIDTPSLGMPCDVYCAGEAWCDLNICVAPLPDGAMCGADNQCASTDCFEGPVFDQCNETAVCI